MGGLTPEEAKWISDNHPGQYEALVKSLSDAQGALPQLEAGAKDAATSYTTARTITPGDPTTYGPHASAINSLYGPSATRDQIVDYVKQVKERAADAEKAVNDAKSAIKQTSFSIAGLEDNAHKAAGGGGDKQLVKTSGGYYYGSGDTWKKVDGLPADAPATPKTQPISITSVDASGRQTITFYNPDTLKPYTSDGRPVSIDVGPAQANYNTSQSVEYLGADIAPGGQAGFYKVRRGADGKIVQVPSADGSGQRIDAEFVSARPAPQVATSYVMSDGQGAGLITWDPTADNGKGAYTTQSIKIDDPGARDKFVADLRSRDLANQLAEINLANARYDATTKQVVGLPMAKAALRTANANADKGELEVIKARSDQLWDLRKRYVLDLHAKGLISEKQAYDYMADQASYQKQVMEREKAALDARKAALDEQRTLAEEERATGARFHTFGWAAGRTLDQQVALEKQIREQAKPGETSGQTIRRQQGMALSTDVKVPGQYQAPETTAAQQAWAKSHPDVFAGPEWETWLANYRNSVDALSGSSTPARSSSALTRPMGDQSWRDRANDPQVPLNDSPGWTSGLANNPATMASATQMPSELAQWQALASGGAPAGAVAVPSPMTGMQAPVANPYDDFTSWLQRQRQVPASMQYPAAAGVDAIA